MIGISDQLNFKFGTLLEEFLSELVEITKSYDIDAKLRHKAMLIKYQSFCDEKRINFVCIGFASIIFLKSRDLDRVNNTSLVTARRKIGNKVV